MFLRRNFGQIDEVINIDVDVILAMLKYTLVGWLVPLEETFKRIQRPNQSKKCTYNPNLQNSEKI